MGLFSWAARLPGKSVEKRLAIWPASTHLHALGFIIPRAPRGLALLSDIQPDDVGACPLGAGASKSRPIAPEEPPEHNRMQVLVRDNNIDQALRVLKKKMQREGVFREMKRRRFYEKPSEQATREKAEAARRARKLARKQAIRDGLIAAPKKKLAPFRKGTAPLPFRTTP